jgi:hypothetical protein
MTFVQRNLIPLVLQVGFVVDCVRIAAHVGPQRPSAASDWAVLVGAIVVAALLGAAGALRVIGPGLRDEASGAGRSPWDSRRAAIALVLGAVLIELIVAGQIHVDAALMTGGAVGR